MDHIRLESQTRWRPTNTEKYLKGAERATFVHMSSPLCYGFHLLSPLMETGGPFVCTACP